MAIVVNAQSICKQISNYVHSPLTLHEKVTAAALSTLLLVGAAISLAKGISAAGALTLSIVGTSIAIPPAALIIIGATFLVMAICILGKILLSNKLQKRGAISEENSSAPLAPNMQSAKKDLEEMLFSANSSALTDASKEGLDIVMSKVLKGDQSKLREDLSRFSQEDPLTIKRPGMQTYVSSMTPSGKRVEAIQEQLQNLASSSKGIDKGLQNALLSVLSQTVITEIAKPLSTKVEELGIIPSLRRSETILEEMSDGTFKCTALLSLHLVDVNRNTAEGSPVEVLAGKTNLTFKIAKDEQTSNWTVSPPLFIRA